MAVKGHTDRKLRTRPLLYAYCNVLQVLLSHHLPIGP